MQCLPMRKLFLICMTVCLVALLSILYSVKYLPINRFAKKDFLKHYSQIFNHGVMESGVMANVTSSITTWWQAAAMIDSYTSGPVRYTCRNTVSKGNWHVCQDEPFRVKAPCLVYSFGIGYDFSFDDAMGSLGCEVHSFDPSMNVPDHIRSDNITFHALGLYHEDLDTFSPHKDMYVTDNQKWKVRNLKTLMKELGHEKRVIDVLKVDIEGYEWRVVEDILDAGLFSRVKQFLTEWHLLPGIPDKKDFVHAFQIYTRLREGGFLEFKVNPHRSTLEFESFNIQGDSEYVNSFFKTKKGLNAS